VATGAFPHSGHLCGFSACSIRLDFVLIAQMPVFQMSFPEDPLTAM